MLDALLPIGDFVAYDILMVFSGSILAGTIHFRGSSTIVLLISAMMGY